MNRGLARQAIVTDDAHRRLFLEVMGEMCALFGAECHAYCLMDTHYHLLLHTPRDNLSGCIRQVNLVFHTAHCVLVSNGDLVYYGDQEPTVLANVRVSCFAMPAIERESSCLLTTLTAFISIPQ